MRTVKNVVGTEVREPTGPALELVDPSTGEVFAQARVSTAEEIHDACEVALDAFQTWKRTTPSVRQQAMLDFAQVLKDNVEELVDLESENTGKPVQVTLDEEVPMMLDQIKFFAGAARVLEGKATGEYMEGFTSSIRREPVGVVGQVAPWNYPLLMAVWKFAPAIAAGNTVVLKPSDTTPVSTARLAELILEADIMPPGVFNVVLGDRDTGASLIGDPIPSMVSITGSVGAGKAVARTASDTVKRVHLELGGKAPVLVFNDVDIAKAAAWLAFTGYFNCGQDCTAPTRLIVQTGVHDEFLAAMTEEINKLKTTYENGRKDPDALVPPSNNVNQFNTVLGFLDRAPDHAQVLTGGARIGDHGFYVAPTLVGNMRQDDEMVQSEIFGPVMTAQKFVDEAEALEMANGVNLALASSVWTKDHGTAMRLARDLDYGCVWINTHIPLQAEMPHGGYKESGYGKDLSMYGLEDYTRIKHVMSALDA